MGLNDRALWELQWHPAGGGRVRRLVLTWRGLRRALVVLGLVGVVVLAFVLALPLGLRAFLTSFTVDAARRENRTLKARQGDLRERAAALSGRVWADVQRGRRLAWAVGIGGATWQPPCPAPPAAGAADAAVASWLSRQGARLDELGEALGGAGSGRAPCPLPALPTGLPIGRSEAVPVALYGWQVSPFTEKTAAHFGATLAAPEGTPVLATGAGRVVFAGGAREHRSNDWARLGGLVAVDHGGGVLTIFGHLRDVAVKRGQSVARGDTIGTVGQTGWTRVPALYYEVRWPLGGVSRPIDPGLVTLSLPVPELDAHLADPTGGLPPEYPQIDRLLAGGVARPGAHRPVARVPRRLRHAAPAPTPHR